MRCVLIDALGRPVDPDVKSTFAIVSGPTARAASSTALVGVASSSSANGVAARPSGADVATTTSVARRHGAASAGSNASAVGGEDEAGLA